MYDLTQVSAHVYYLPGPTNIGLVRLNDTEVCLIDSGNDKDAGKRVKRILEENGWTLKAIYNTHFHADHIGGNAYLQKQTGCAVYAPAMECAFVNYPILNPTLQYGGFPGKALRHKFLLAKESSAQPLTPEALPAGMTAVALPGHSLSMTGYRTEDVVFLADCLASRRTLEKYRITYLYDAAAYLQTLEQVKTMQAKCFIPAHAEAAEDIAALAQYNIDTAQEIGACIVECCKTPIGSEALLEKLFGIYGMQMSMEQYTVVGSTVRSYLTWLENAGKIQYLIDGDRLLWCQTAAQETMHFPKKCPL